MTQTVVITGASAGIARATARLYGQRGARVGLIARGQAGLDGAASDVERAGGTALAISADVADYDQHGTMAALARMRPRDHGTIVQVGSALSARSIPLQSAYCGAKHGINGFTSSLRCELLHDKSQVRVTVVQMPAVNTPQFSWVRSRLPDRPQPVPPIYQPEVAARGVLFAAKHPGRREYWAGASTVATLAANKFVPSLLDRYLARTGYSSQQTGQPASPDRPDNLMQPVDRGTGTDHGAHGEFDGRSHPRSAQLWLSQLRAAGALAACGTAAATVAAVATVAARRR